jgi:asparagine synthase (glutamine-hydrolysing)
MKALIGWAGGSNAHDASRCNADMAAPFHDQGGCYAVCADASRAGDARAFSVDGITCALTGHPRWKDPALREHAAQYGHHAALARAWRQHDDNFLNQLSGHFALALVDTARQVTLLAIDRIGAHPLCYAVAPDDTLVFGSTTDAVKAHPALRVSIAPQSLYDYLYFHMIPSPTTVYREIRKLEPSQCLRFEGGKIQLRHYWQPSFVESDGPGFPALRDEFIKLVRACVSNCEPDQVTGAFLSGGTDSSTVSGMLASLQSTPAKTYSIGFAQEGYDEISYARIASRHFKTEQHEYYVTADDVAEAFSRVAKAYDEPFGNSSAIPTYFCARLAKSDGTQVLLAGDGGDELFGGNARYATQKVFDFYHHVPRFLRSGLLEPLFVTLPFARWLPPARKVRSYIEQARSPMPDRTERYNFLHRTDPRRILTPEFLAQINLEHPLELLRDTYQRAPSTSLLNRMLYLDWKFTLADNDLRKVNRMCALAGVDVRYPMLDDDLIELSTRVPPSLKLKGLKLRWFFKESLKDFLPREIIHKTKHGFGLPFGEWLKASPALQDNVYSSLKDLKKRGIVRAEFIDELVNTHRGGHAAYYGTQIWVLAMLEQWFRHHGINP